MATKKRYEELEDVERLQKQWHKMSGLHTREEWSAAIVRAATAAEIAANYAIRCEFKANSNFDAKFINKLLIWANGLAGKLDRLLLPLSAEDNKKNKKMKTLKSLAESINQKRNAVVHQGEFCNEDEAKAVIEQARIFITTMVKFYEPEFMLNERQRIK